MKKENKFLIAFFALIVLIILIFVISSMINKGGGIKGDLNLMYDNNIPTTKSNDLNLSGLDKTYINNDYIKGNPSAPVTIVEFSDFQCPFCVKFYNETYKQIEDNYIKTGKVKFVYRDFPLSGHQYAEGAAVAAECAGLQDKYYQMYTLLFVDGVSGNKNQYIEYAKTIGIDETKFKECINSKITYPEIQQDYKDGLALGITSTPSYFINGEEVVGAQPYSVFQEVIDRKLAGIK
jgi:protein-disulfide isomerase